LRIEAVMNPSAKSQSTLEHIAWLAEIWST
jgi:hypothetical protein